MWDWLTRLDRWLARPLTRRANVRRRSLLKQQLVAAQGRVVDYGSTEEEMEEMESLWEEICRERGRPVTALHVTQR